MDSYNVVNAGGFKWAVRESSRIGGLLQDNLGPNERETHNFDVLKKGANPALNFIDVGANVGGFSIRLARYFKEVHAFEPNEFNADALNENIVLNKITNIVQHKVGLGDKEMECQMSMRGGGSSILATLPELEYATIQVKTLDSLNIPDVGAIKIDTEGYDEQVLEGAKNTILKYKPILVIETHEHSYTGEPKIAGQKNRIKAFLDSIGYKWEVLFTAHQRDEHLFAYYK